MADGVWVNSLTSETIAVEMETTPSAVTMNSTLNLTLSVDRPRSRYKSKSAFLLDHVPYDDIINGYFVPVLVLVIVVCNLLVCVVLLRRNMRTATNAVLVAIACSDLLTGLWPLPVYIWFFALGAKDDWVPYSWCYAYFCLTDYLPTVFHTASIWLTVLLAAQRYVCVCRGDLASSGTAQRQSVVVKIIVAIYLAALASQSSRFVEFDFLSVTVKSRRDTTAYVTGCRYRLASFIARYEQAYFNTIYWFRVVFIHLIPCSLLVILTVLLVGTMRRAQQRKRRLLGSSCRQSRAMSEVDQQALGTSFRRCRSRLLAEGNSTTLMLVTVVGVFLAVELPMAVTLILLILQQTFGLSIFTRGTSAVVSHVCNLVILLSYPTNFFIYCAMSRAFRTTFSELFCAGAGSVERRMTTCNTRVVVPQPLYGATDADQPPPQAAAAAAVLCGDAQDGRNDVILAIVDRCQDDAVIELVEDPNHAHVTNV